MKLSKQFIIYLISNLVCMIGENIDTGFSNSLGKDSIVVFASYHFIYWLEYSLFSLGKYAFEVELKKGRICLRIGLFISVVLGVLVFLCRGVIPRFYSLTDSQYILFEKVLFISAFMIPLQCISEFTYQYAMVKALNRIITIGNIIFYGLMIVTDYIVVKLGYGLDKLLLASILSYVLYDVYLLRNSGILKEKYKCSIKEIKRLLYNGFNLAVNGITARVGTIIFNIYASKLGTELYAIHCVCFSVMVACESITDSLHLFIRVKIQDIKDKCKYQYCIMLSKRYLPFCLLLILVISQCVLVVLCGEVGYLNSVKWLWIYLLENLVLVYFECFKAYLNGMKATIYVRYGSLVGSICVRLPIVIIGYYLGLGLFPFAISSGIDYFVRGFYFHTCSKKVKKNIALLHKNVNDTDVPCKVYNTGV